ncbi:ANTAR domain-containing protein [Streptomyces sp. NPDC017988]|uniref:ANTAR domain-containing protein n=1 Tax=Streptomyces sp. NPDC017988 TaxID=3365025 RepID=UPI0037AEB94A
MDADGLGVTLVPLAVGILAEKHRLPPDDALARMRAHALRHDQPLHQIADHVMPHQSLD